MVRRNSHKTKATGGGEKKRIFRFGKRKGKGLGKKGGRTRGPAPVRQDNEKVRSPGRRKG